MRFLLAFFTALMCSCIGFAQAWTITHDLGRQENLYAVCNLPEHHFLIAGSAWTAYPEPKKTFVSKIDPNGAILWTKSYNVGPDPSSYQEMKIVPLNNYEHFLIYGETYGAVGSGSYGDIYFTCSSPASMKTSSPRSTNPPICRLRWRFLPTRPACC